MRTIDQNHYVDQAEQVIRTLQSRTRERRDGTSVPVPMVTTSKIRNLLAMTSDIYNETLGLPQGPLPERLRSRIEYLRVRFIYEAGKDPEGRVRDFVTEAKILDILKEIQGDKDNFLLFAHYMEALVAFHKFYGGRD
mgnify:CR=1 FL=1